MHTPTATSYRKGCRCPETRAAWNAWSRDYKRRRADPNYQSPRKVQPPRKPQPDPEFRDARMDALRARNYALAVGAGRRLRAMMRIGHTLAALAAESELSAGRAARLTGNDLDGGIWPKTAERIAKVYDRLQFEQGPSRRTAMWALKRDYLPPAAWHPDDLDNPDAGPTWPWRQAEQEDVSA